jgi:hypothetical protein
MEPAISKAFNRPRIGMETERGRGVAAWELPKARGIHPINDALPLCSQQEPPQDLTRGFFPAIEFLSLYCGANSISIGANSEPPARIEAPTPAMPFRRIRFEKSASARQLSIMPKANSGGYGVPLGIPPSCFIQ